MAISDTLIRAVNEIDGYLANDDQEPGPELVSVRSAMLREGLSRWFPPRVDASGAYCDPAPEDVEKAVAQFNRNAEARKPAIRKKQEAFNAMCDAQMTYAKVCKETEGSEPSEVYDAVEACYPNPAPTPSTS